jgi:hypothetical protein
MPPCLLRHGRGGRRCAPGWWHGCRYGAYGVLYQVDFYLRAYPEPMVKIEGYRPRRRGLQAVKIDLVKILRKLDSVIDLELFNCIRLGLELHLSLLSIYKERLGTPLCTHTFIQSIQRTEKRRLDVGFLLDHEGLNQYKSLVPCVTVEFLGLLTLKQSSWVTP